MRNLGSVLNYCTLCTPDARQEDAYELRFIYGAQDTTNVVIVTIRVEITEADQTLTITNMTTRPPGSCGKGFGSHALSLLLKWATQNNFTKVIAAQVQEESGQFWKSNGFQKCSGSNPCNDQERTLPLS